MTAKASGILCLNAGSSSLKFAVYEHKAAAAGGDESRLVAGAVERIGLKEGRFRLNEGHTAATETAGEYPDHGTAVHAVFDALERRSKELTVRKTITAALSTLALVSLGVGVAFACDDPESQANAGAKPKTPCMPLDKTMPRNWSS